MDTANTSISTLFDENKDLRFEIEQQFNIIESQKQEIHNSHRKIECLNSMKIEMEIEIEALTGLHQINGNLESKVRHLETELSSLRLKFSSLETDLQDERTKHEEVILKLSSEMSNLKNEVNDTDSDRVTKDQLLLKMNDLQEANTIITQRHSSLQHENKNLLEKTFVLDLSINEKIQELQEMKDLFEVKSNDLKSALKLVEELQEEKTKLNVELSSFKCHPTAANNKRGNSLFAEVEDKRVFVTHKLEAVQNKYKELKKSFIKKNAELKALEAENIELRKQWKEDQNSPYDTVATLLGSHKTRIQELSHMVSLLEKRPESPQIIAISEVTNAHVNCIKTMIEDERKISRELRNEMEQRSIHQLALNEQVYKLRQTVMNLKTKGMKDEATIIELKHKFGKDIS